MSDLSTLHGVVERIVNPLFKYAVPRMGKVSSVSDPDSLGRVLVLIPSLGWDTDDKGAWCYPTDKKALVVPEVDSWVIVEWIDRNPDMPIYRGVPTAIKDQIPSTYNGDPNTKILFEQDSDNVIKYLDGVFTMLVKNELLLGGEDGKAVGRVDDETISDSSTDSTFWSMWTAFFAIVTGAPIPEPGSGAPSAFQAALSLAISGAGGTPSEQKGKINEGSSIVKAVD